MRYSTHTQMKKKNVDWGKGGERSVKRVSSLSSITSSVKVASSSPPALKGPSLSPSHNRTALTRAPASAAALVPLLPPGCPPREIYRSATPSSLDRRVEWQEMRRCRRRIGAGSTRASGLLYLFDYFQANSKRGGGRSYGEDVLSKYWVRQRDETIKKQYIVETIFKFIFLLHT